MGLFGYNQKDFDKNTAAFQAEIDDLRELIIQSGRQDLGVGKVLDLATRMLRDIQYPKNANGKALEAVDDRIRGLLQKIRDDIQNERPEQVSVHAKMLNDAIVKSRKFGKERLSAKEIEAEEIVAATEGELRAYIRKKTALYEQMKDIERESDRLADDDPEFDYLDKKYRNLEIQMKQIDRAIQVCTNRYNVNARIVNMREEGKVYEELPPVLANERDLDREIEKVNELAAREDTYISNVGSSLDEFEAGRDEALARTSESNSPLRARRAAKEAEALESGIDDADVEPDTGLSGLRAKRNK